MPGGSASETTTGFPVLPGPVEEWVPRAQRHANLDGAASVLGYKPLISARRDRVRFESHGAHKPACWAGDAEF